MNKQQLASKISTTTGLLFVKAYFQQREGTTLSVTKVRMRLDGLLRLFILKGEIE